MKQDAAQMLYDQSVAAMNNSYLRDDDRGFVIISTSLIEVSLQGFTKLFIVKKESFRKRIYSNNNLMGNFGNQIDFCFACGHVSEYEFNILNAIRKIRNEFAHKIGNISLSDANFVDKLNSLKIDHDLIDYVQLNFNKFGTKPDGKTLFYAAVQYILNCISTRLLLFFPPKTVEPPNPIESIEVFDTAAIDFMESLITKETDQAKLAVLQQKLTSLKAGLAHRKNLLALRNRLAQEKG